MNILQNQACQSQMISPEQSNYRDSIEAEPRRSRKALDGEAQRLRLRHTTRCWENTRLFSTNSLSGEK